MVGQIITVACVQKVIVGGYRTLPQITPPPVDDRNRGAIVAIKV